MSGIDEMPESVKTKRNKNVYDGVRGWTCSAIVFDELSYCMPPCQEWIRIPIIDDELWEDVGD